MTDTKMSGASNERLGYDPGDNTGRVPYGANFLGVNFNTGQATVASSGALTQIVAASTTRLGLLVTNRNATGNLYLVNASSVASSTASSVGYAVPANTTVALPTRSGVWGNASSGQIAVTYFEQLP